MSEAAFRRGYAAHLAEKAEVDNPYPAGSAEGGSWTAGYLKARTRAGHGRLANALREIKGHLDILEPFADGVPELVHLTKGEMIALRDAALRAHEGTDEHGPLARVGNALRSWRGRLWTRSSQLRTMRTGR